MAYSIVVAGTTKNTVLCAQALQQDSRFTITGIITPEPKPIGRKQVLTKNPLHLFATEEKLPVTQVQRKIDQDIKTSLEAQNNDRPDLLLVVDFGYIIPNWLLAWPKLASLNIHPSELPKWRGSSPGQFAILYGEKTSAVTLMIMNDQLDQGPILTQHSFSISNTWNHQDYYNHSFELITHTLANDVASFVDGSITPKEQSKNTPTPIAGRLSKEDAFVDWDNLLKALNGNDVASIKSPLLEKAKKTHPSFAELIIHAARAFDPWPQLWTTVPTTKGPRRMKILTARTENGALVLEKVHIASQQPANWNQVKNIVKK